MKYRLVKIEELSGKKASIYTIQYDEKENTLFEDFLFKHKDSLKGEVSSILGRLRTIGAKTGAREHFFKTWEGRPGDGVAALYDTPKKNCAYIVSDLARQLSC